MKYSNQTRRTNWGARVSHGKSDNLITDEEEWDMRVMHLFSKFVVVDASDGSKNSSLPSSRRISTTLTFRSALLLGFSSESHVHNKEDFCYFDDIGNRIIMRNMTENY
jgi:hypothetical protein